MKIGFRKVIVGFLFTLPLIVASCMMDDNGDIPDFNEQLQKDIQAIDEYLATKGLTAIADVSGIRYIIHEDSVGGKKPTIDSCVTANYQAKLLNEQEFDKGTGISFPLRGVIDGWKYGIPLLNVGDSATLYIPSGLGYGHLGYPEGGIPRNANLIFHVAVKKVGSTYRNSDRSCN
jgi:peptidylprolyl isomerase/FKBP-type peptidyl-prolyl cis-trans isomerase FkpA/FKBP-type peptidyl-prolyl cis-trans isomerase FklB